MYNVVFRYTDQTGIYEGGITSSSFASKEAFDAWYDADMREGQSVLEEGITDERIDQLISGSPISTDIAVIVENATNANGEVSPLALRLEAINLEIGRQN